MEPSDLTGDVDLRGAQIAELCDLLDRLPLQQGHTWDPSVPWERLKQPFDVSRLRTAVRVQRAKGATVWRVTLSHNRGTVGVPIAGLD